TSTISSVILSHGAGDPPELHSFPTRRSSDLGRASVRRHIHDAPAQRGKRARLLARRSLRDSAPRSRTRRNLAPQDRVQKELGARSEEHTSELQSLAYLVCRLLLEKKKYKPYR